MNKIVVIGDIHGRNLWKNIVEKEKDADKIIFIGDYFDSFDVKVPTQIENFRDIIEFKKSRPKQVILLIGNHDYHYIRGNRETYSGYSNIYAASIGFILDDVLKSDLLKICHIENGKFIFTHAGLTKNWCEYAIGSQGPYNAEILENAINDLFKYTPNIFEFRIGPNNSGYGNDITQGPLWVRPVQLRMDKIDGYIQVVGHTEQAITNEHDVWVIDSLPYGEYLVIEDNVPRIEKMTFFHLLK